MLSNLGGWSFRQAILWSILANVPLQAIMLWANFDEERVWLDQWETAPGATIGYALGRLFSLPIIVAMIVAIQNLFVALTKTPLLRRILGWPWAQAALWLLGLMLMFGGIQRDYYTGEQNMPLVISAGICWAAALGLGFLRGQRANRLRKD